MTAIRKYNIRLMEFGRDEEGAQIVEYGLIIAVVSIALLIALATVGGGSGPFGAFVTRATACLTTATCL